MTAAHRVWGKGWIARVACAALLLGSIACATASRPKTGPDAAVLSDVRVEERGEMTVVTLQGVGNPLYATREEGDRLVVDVSGVTPGGVPDEIALSAGAVEGVEVSAMVDASGRRILEVRPENLSAGMILADDLLTETGRLLLAKGARLSAAVVMRVKLLAESDVMPPIRIVRMPTAEAIVPR